MLRSDFMSDDILGQFVESVQAGPKGSDPTRFQSAGYSEPEPEGYSPRSQALTAGAEFGAKSQHGKRSGRGHGPHPAASVVRRYSRAPPLRADVAHRKMAWARR